jgi:heptose-I-phosphate ethanolaminephosphotransferase
MTPLLSKINNFLLAPIRSFPASFIFLALALILPDIVAEVRPRWIISNLSLFNYRILLCAGISYVLVTFAYLVSKLSSKLGILLIILFHVCIYPIVLTDIFLYNFFGSHINAYMLQLANETNSQETTEFLETYLKTKIFFGVFVKFIIFIGAEILLFKLFQLWRKYFHSNDKYAFVSKCKIAFSSFVSIFLLISLGFLVYLRPGFSFDWAANLEEDRIWDCGLIDSFVFNIYQSGIQFFDERSTFERCEKSNQNITATRDESSSPKDIVIIIGESYNRHHSSLYGYDHLTNPRLSQLSHLYVFEDVISPINGTSPVFKNFLSMASVDDSLEWCDAPLFPAIFKHVGYNVSFFSNQFVKCIDMSPWDASAGFFNRPNIEPRIFSHRNSQTHQYDEGIIEEYKSQRHDVENDSLNLLFFHLIGQHVSTAQRYPEDRNFFHPNDYQRPELTEAQALDVANYDNATLYNDSVVNEIIRLFLDKDALILYFADHGDEANDYRPHVGRDFNLNAAGAPGLHCQLDVPFLIYLTDSCCILHPELERRIAQSIHHPFMLDDLPHLLLDISSIQTTWFQPSRSLINEKYNFQRRRIINGYSTTSPIDYDSVCKAYGDWKIGYTKQ